MQNIRSFEQHHPRIGEDVYIDPGALLIGDVQIGNQSSVWPMTVIRGDINRIEIGERTNIQDGSVLHVTHASPYATEGFPLFIGDDVTVGHKACLHACRIEHHCLIGMGAIVLDGAHLPPYTLLAAGSLVAPGKTLEGGYLWSGTPAKKNRLLRDKELEYLDYSAKYYAELGKRHLLQLTQK